MIYYGDEIGMGDNIYLGDRNGVRTPMQWSNDRNAGFSQANSQRLYLPIIIDSQYHYEAVNVENQNTNLSSLLWLMKRLISVRQRYKAFGRGDCVIVSTNNHRILAYLRRTDAECLLIVSNLSRYAQWGELLLEGVDDLIPVEMFGLSPFPRIEKGVPYRLTLGPYGFYLFNLMADVSALEQPIR